MSSHEEFTDFKFTLKEIVEATDNFAEENLIGHGGFGKIYKGNLLVSEKPNVIAARRLHYDYGQGDLEFWNEISVLASLKLKHDNLVSFIGFSDEKGEKIIINEYEANGSLDKYLGSRDLTWMQRLQICVDVARALNYIHCGDGHYSSVIHRNIKSSKILLDENWKPKLSGFEHSKTNTRDRKHRLLHTEIKIGTIGYVDPTYEKTGFVTHKTDVYSFGVVLFEVLCGRRAFLPYESEPQYFPDQDKEGKLKESLQPTVVQPSYEGPDNQLLPSSPPPRVNKEWSLSSDGQLQSYFDGQPSSFGSDIQPGSYEHSPIKSNSMKERRFKLQPAFTMKRLDRYLHSPNEELLAKLVKSHYDEENLNLDDIIDPDLRKQMDVKSFKIFSETAYNCLKEKGGDRPNIDQILPNLEKALELQFKYENHGRHLENLKISLNDIEVATENFNIIYLIGSGGFGDVYKAELKVPIEGKTKGEITMEYRTVAIKRIKEEIQGKEGFNAEIELLTTCKHTNVVSLFGFCDEGPNMILVYEHAPNNSLEDYMTRRNSSTNLTWVQRINIGIDIARGLNYIHTRVEDEQRIVHRDIKSANILLGENWVAKIADFGLSRFHGDDLKEKTVLTMNVAGTKYYLCPEYMENGRLKTAVDIYSFGVVLFEILSGKLAYNPKYGAEGIAYVARRCYKLRSIHEMVDDKIGVDKLGSTLRKGPNQASLKTYSDIAHRCIAITQNDRPTAKEILEELEKALENALSLQEDLVVAGEVEVTTNRREWEQLERLMIPFDDIKEATNNFGDEHVIGSGGYGKVYRAKLEVSIEEKGEFSRAWRTVAIRIIPYGKGKEGSNAEIALLGTYKHPNIVSLLGFCNEDGHVILVYEYADNKSLDYLLRKDDNSTSLTWVQRIENRY